MNEKLEQLETRLSEWGNEDTATKERVDLLLELAEAHFSGDDPQRLIEVDSEVGKGSTFTVIGPCSGAN